jgi:hypothetical protein
MPTDNRRVPALWPTWSSGTDSHAQVNPPGRGELRPGGEADQIVGSAPNRRDAHNMPGWQPSAGQQRLTGSG